MSADVPSSPVEVGTFRQLGSKTYCFREYECAFDQATWDDGRVMVSDAPCFTGIVTVLMHSMMPVPASARFAEDPAILAGTMQMAQGVGLT